MPNSAENSAGTIGTRLLQSPPPPPPLPASYCSMHAHLFFHIHILLAYARTLRTPSHVPPSHSHAHTIQCYCRYRFFVPPFPRLNFPFFSPSATNGKLLFFFSLFDLTRKVRDIQTPKPRKKKVRLYSSSLQLLFEQKICKSESDRHDRVGGKPGTPCDCASCVKERGLMRSSPSVHHSSLSFLSCFFFPVFSVVFSIL